MFVIKFRKVQELFPSRKVLYSSYGTTVVKMQGWISVKLHLRDGRTDKHARQLRPPRSPPSRRVDVAATRDKPTDGQTPRIIFVIIIIIYLLRGNVQCVIK